MKRFVILLLTAVLALTMPLSALAAGQIEVTEDISVSDDYDWTRFKGQNVTLNVYNWGEYISNGNIFRDLDGPGGKRRKRQTDGKHHRQQQKHHALHLFHAASSPLSAFWSRR